VEDYEFAKSGTDNCGDPIFSLSRLKERFELIHIKTKQGSAWFCHSKDLDWMRFSLFDYHSSSDSDIGVSIIFHGMGPSNVLREMRHIYWGADGKGYTFYLNRDAVRKSMDILDKFFDD